MSIIIEPTPELTEITVNGNPVPMRIWSGITGAGVAVEVYVYAITPNNDEDTDKLREETRAAGMVRAASLADIGPYKKNPEAK